jgi:hypothetical protein
VDKVVALRQKLELVRVPLAKFQIANDSKVKEPIYFVKQGGPPSEPEPYSSKQRIEYTPTNIVSLTTGSCGWRVYDTGAKAEIEIFRQDISDEILALWAS